MDVAAWPLHLQLLSQQPLMYEQKEPVEGHVPEKAAAE